MSDTVRPLPGYEGAATLRFARLRDVVAVVGRALEERADLSRGLLHGLRLAARVGGARIARCAVVETGQLDAPTVRERAGQRIPRWREEAQALAATDQEHVGRDRPEPV